MSSTTLYQAREFSTCALLSPLEDPFKSMLHTLSPPWLATFTLSSGRPV